MNNKAMLNLNQIYRLFPFAFVTDKKGRLLSAGPSLKKLNLRMKSKSEFFQYYQITKPITNDIDVFLQSNVNEMIILEADDSSHKLMGQFVNDVKGGRKIFIVNLFLNDLKKLSLLNLTFSDFAIQDQIFDFLMLLQTHQRAILEADRINKKLAEAHEVAIKASAMKSQFLANMSHELRTPMNGVLGMSSVLLETELAADQKEYVEAIVTSGEGMLALVNDILDLSKIEAGFIELQSRPFQIADILEGVSHTVRHVLEKKNLNLLIESNQLEKMSFIGDEDRLKQVLLNFTGNAVKFTNHGEVRINLTRTQRESEFAEIRFEITDTGVGMDLETQKRIFNPFVQGDSSTTKKFGGTGLGLSICKKLVEAMGGQIGFASEVGRGSTFWFTVRLGVALEQNYKKIA